MSDFFFLATACWKIIIIIPNDYLVVWGVLIVMFFSFPTCLQIKHSQMTSSIFTLAKEGSDLSLEEKGESLQPPCAVVTRSGIN